MQELVLSISVAGFTSRLKRLRTQLGLYLMPDLCSPWFNLDMFFVGGIRGEEERSVLPVIVFRYPASREEGSREMASRRYAVLGQELYCGSRRQRKPRGLPPWGHSAACRTGSGGEG